MNSSLRRHGPPGAWPWVMLLGGCLSCAGGEATAQSIGVNFVGDTGAAGTLSAAEVAGAPGVAQANWNNAPARNGALSSLVDRAGRPSSLSIEWSGLCGTGSNVLGGAGSDFTLMQGFLSGECAPGLGFQLHDIPYAVYDVMVYMSGNGSPSGYFGYLSPASFITPPVAEGQSPIVQYASDFHGDFVEANPAVAGNYYRFRGLNFGSLAVTSIPFPIAAVQVVRASGPATVPSRFRVSLAEERGYGDFSLDGTHLSYRIQLYYPAGANPRLELRGPSADGQDAPLVATLPSASCQQLEFSYCNVVTGELEVTGPQAAELASDLWQLSVIPFFSFYPEVRGRIMNQTNPRPTLQVLHSPGEVRLQWPIASREFILEAATTLEPSGPWKGVPDPVEIIGEDYSVRVDAVEGNQFYRLRSGP